MTKHASVGFRSVGFRSGYFLSEFRTVRCLVARDYGPMQPPQNASVGFLGFLGDYGPMQPPRNASVGFLCGFLCFFGFFQAHTGPNLSPLRENVALQNDRQPGDQP